MRKRTHKSSLLLLTVAVTFVFVLRVPPSSCQPGVGYRFFKSSFSDKTNVTISRPEQNNRESEGYKKNALHHHHHHDDTTSISMNEFFGMFGKLGTNWNTLLAMFRSVISAAGGKTYKQDVHVDTLEQGREWLYRTKDWKSLLEPHNQQLYDDFGVTVDDILDSFLHWASADEVEDLICKLQGGVNGRESSINVSKAQRRLERYVIWMNDLQSDLHGLTTVSVKDAFDILDTKVTIDDCNRLVWWLDLATIDWDRFDKLEPKEITRVFVWLSHYMLFHPNAQQYGMVFINSLNQIGFWSFMTMLPVDLGMQLDEFMISVIPLKTKFVVLLERPPWARFAYQLLKPFLQSEMRRRVVVIEEGHYPPSYLFEVVGGTNVIPDGMKNYSGSPSADIIHPYINQKVKSQGSIYSSLFAFK